VIIPNKPSPPKVVDVVTAVEAVADKVKEEISPAQAPKGAFIEVTVPSLKNSPAATPQIEATVSTPATPPVVAKVSWLKKVGSVIGKILGIVAKDAKPVADTAAAVATAIFPQWGALIAAGDSLISKIALQAIAVESVAAATGTASGTGPAKLAQVLTDVGPAIDQWVANAFPGAAQISTVQKAGLISAVVAIINEVEGTPAATTPAA